MKKQALLPTGNAVLKRGLLLGIILLAHAPLTALGQELVAGETIRLRPSQSTGTGRGWTEGSVVRFAPDTLWYQSSGSVSAMSWDNVELKRPTYRNHRWAGLGIGAAAGGAIGALVAVVNFSPIEKLALSCSILSFVCMEDHVGPLMPVNSRAEETATGALRGVLIEGGLGYFIGKALGRWETVELDQITVGDGNLAVSMSIRP